MNGWQELKHGEPMWNEWVLVFAPRFGACKAKMQKLETGGPYVWRLFDGGPERWSRAVIIHPTHWMPLPEPPKENDNAKN